MVGMESIRCFASDIWLPMIMAFLGALSKTAREGWKSWRRFAANCCIAAFVGIEIYLLLDGTDFSVKQKIALVGIASHAGVVAVEWLMLIFNEWMKKITGKDLPPQWDGIERRKGG